MAYTVYTVGDLTLLRQVLTGVAMMFDPSNNTLLNSNNGAHLGSAAGMGALVTLTLIVVKGLYNQAIRLEELLICVIMYAVLFVPKITVTLEDAYTGTTTVVNNVPVGVAAPAVLMSGVVHSLTEKMDTAFSTVNGNYVGLTQEGFVSPIKLFVQLRHGVKKDFDQDFVATLMEYFRYCLKDSSGNLKRDNDLMSSGDLSQFFQNNNVNAMTFSYFSNGVTPKPYPGPGQIESCNSAGARINVYMTGWAHNNLPGSSASSDNRLRWAIGKSNQTMTSNNVLFGDSLQSLFGTGVMNADAALMNIAFSNLVVDMRRRGGIVDPDMAMASITMTESMEQWKADQVGAGEMFQKTMNQAMSVFLFLFFALAPIVAVVTAIMGMAGIKLLLSYFMFGIWTQSWLPVAAVINFYIQSTVQEELARLLATPGFTVNKMFSPMYIDNTFNLLTQKLAMASSMMSMVPTITAAILGGGVFALTSLAGKLGGQGGYIDEKKLAGHDPVKTSGTQQQLDYSYKNHGLGSSIQNGSFGSFGGLHAPSMNDVSNSGNYNASSALGRAVQDGQGVSKTAEQAHQLAKSRLAQAMASFTDGSSNVIGGGTSKETQTQNGHLFQLADQFQQDNGLSVDRSLSKQIISQMALTGKTGALVAAMELMRSGKFEAGAAVAKQLFREAAGSLGIKFSATEGEQDSTKVTDGSKRSYGTSFGKNINWSLAEKAATKIEDTVKKDGSLQQAYQNSIQAQALVKEANSMSDGFTRSANSGQNAGFNYSRNVAEFWADFGDGKQYDQGIALSNMMGTVSRIANNPHGKGGVYTQEFAQTFITDLEKAGHDRGAIRNVIHGAINSSDAGERAVGMAALGALLRGTGVDGLVQMGRGYEQASEDQLSLKDKELKANALMAKLKDEVPRGIKDGKSTLDSSEKKINGEVKYRWGKANAGASDETYHKNGDNLLANIKQQEWDAFQGEWKKTLDRQTDLINKSIKVGNGQVVLGGIRDAQATVESADLQRRILDHSNQAFGYANDARRGDTGAWIRMQEEQAKAQALMQDKKYQDLPESIRRANQQMDETVTSFINDHGGNFDKRTPDPTEPKPVSYGKPPGQTNAVEGRIRNN